MLHIKFMHDGTWYEGWCVFQKRTDNLLYFLAATREPEDPRSIVLIVVLEQVDRKKRKFSHLRLNRNELRASQISIFALDFYPDAVRGKDYTPSSSIKIVSHPACFVPEMFA